VSLIGRPQYSVTILSPRAIRYLGVIIDMRLSFKEHFSEANNETANIARALT